MNKTIKLVSFNIDGLPETIDLNDLPWILRPIAWIYKLIKGTTVITINDDCNKADSIKRISEYISKSDADIIGVQEDFNYHTELMSHLKDKYDCGTYTGGFDLSNLFSNSEWLSYFPLPRFKCDGINLITKKSRVVIGEETIKRWKKSYGYFTHANDLLTHKGFRYYNAFVDGEFNIDVYVIHMDADFYSLEKHSDVSKDIEARGHELKQLAEYIKFRYDGGYNIPIIIIGDTNSYDSYEWDVDNIKSNLINPINEIDGLEIKEAIPLNLKDCDRVYFINNKEASYKLNLKDCQLDTSAGRLSDHKPLIVNFEIKKTL